MGPWTHGGWARGTGEMLGNVSYGPSPSLLVPAKRGSALLQVLPERRQARRAKLAEAYVFESGTNHWRTFDAWPPKGAQDARSTSSPAAPSALRPEGRRTSRVNPSSTSS